MKIFIAVMLTLHLIGLVMAVAKATALGKAAAVIEALAQAAIVTWACVLLFR